MLFAKEQLYLPPVRSVLSPTVSDLFLQQMQQIEQMPASHHKARMQLRAARRMRIPWIDLSEPELGAAKHLGYYRLIWDAEMVNAATTRSGCTRVIWRELPLDLPLDLRRNR